LYIHCRNLGFVDRASPYICVKKKPTRCTIYPQFILSINLYVSSVKRDQLDVTCFIISLFNAQHVSGVNTSILRSLRLICLVISWVVLLWFDVCWCYVVVWLWWYGIRMQVETLLNYKDDARSNKHKIHNLYVFWAYV